MLTYVLDRSMPEPNTGCWLWLGSITEKGHGKAWANGKTVVAHRVSYEAFVGPIPDGQCALHRCDTPACVNPAHLWLGTRGDNNTDRCTKGRNADRRGEKHHLAKLTEAEVIAIRAAGGVHREIAARFGIAGSMVSRIKALRVWSHV